MPLIDSIAFIAQKKIACNRVLPRGHAAGLADAWSTNWFKGLCLAWARLVLGACVCMAFAANAVTTPAPQSITVVMDNNYPPYTFLDAEGHLQGILVDTWALWSKRTGIAVKLDALDWGQALARMGSRQADVIDTIFVTPERQKIYDFSEPYANIEVPIFFNKKISGIVDVDSLKGFTVGVKAGDACIDKLQAHHVTNLKTYASFESIVKAAAADDLMVFCMDKPPAMYFLYKNGLNQLFKFTKPLSADHLHWAVHRGNTALKQTITDGFARISDAEKRQIEEKWMGAALADEASILSTQEMLEVLLAILALIIGLVIWNRSLHSRVMAKTAELTATQHTLEEKNQRFTQASDAAGLGFWDYDIGSKTLKWDAWMYRIYGHPAMDGDSPYDLWAKSLHPDDRARSEQELVDAINGVREFDTAFRIIHPDGSIRRIKAVASAIRDASGCATKMFGTNFDITNAWLAEKRQNQLISKLTSTNEELNSFAYVASHDLKSPLRGIDQLATWIAEDMGDQLSTETQGHLRLMQTRIKRMENLLDDLLAYSRAGRSDQEAVQVNTHDLVQEVFELMGANGKQIHLSVAESMPTLLTRKVPLELVFRNLMSNAIKHHDKAQGSISISARPVTDGFEFEVKDDGPGIPPEHQQRVFAMFQTLKPRDEVEGSGIGLALVKKAVLSVGGDITLESDGIHGCTFRFTWPNNSSMELTQ